MELQRAFEVANRILLEGHPYHTSQTHDGGPENGVWTVEFTGFRWGKLKLELSPNGSVNLFAEKAGNDLYPVLWEVIYDSSVLGKMLGHWDDPQRRKYKDALQLFVKGA